GEREVFVMSVTGMHREHLFTGDVAEPPAAGGEDASARTRFAAFQAALADLGTWLPAGAAATPATYAPARLAVYVGPARPHRPARPRRADPWWPPGRSTHRPELGWPRSAPRRGSLGSGAASLRARRAIGWLRLPVRRRPTPSGGAARRSIRWSSVLCCPTRPG